MLTSGPVMESREGTGDLTQVRRQGWGLWHLWPVPWRRKLWAPLRGPSCLAWGVSMGFPCAPGLVTFCGYPLTLGQYSHLVDSIVGGEGSLGVQQWSSYFWGGSTEDRTHDPVLARKAVVFFVMQIAWVSLYGKSTRSRVWLSKPTAV